MSQIELRCQMCNRPESLGVSLSPYGYCGRCLRVIEQTEDAINRKIETGE